MESFKIFTPTPIVGYGYDLSEFWTTIETAKPAAIIMDGGSTDPGPYMLGTGRTICGRQSFVRDLTPVLEACAAYDIKLLIGSAGGAGTNEQVDHIVDIIKEIAENLGHEFKIASIKFQDDRELFMRKRDAGKCQPCGPGPELQKEDIEKASAIVAQMGAEPFLKALQDGVDIIVAGRSYDPAPFAAFSMYRGVHRDPAWHMGKIMECGGLCAVPKGRSMLATMHEHSFELTPTNPIEACTPRSVAAHTLYEKSRPDRLPGPGGVLHMDNATYVQMEDKRSVLVKGSKFVPTPTYQIKLEGAEQVGFRTVFIGGVRDPILIREMDSFLEIVRTRTNEAFPKLGTADGPQLIFHVYGKNAVMGPLETSTTVPHEVGILGEVVAQTQQDADAIAGFARVVVLHAEYDGQVATAGNLASPLTPLEQSAGPVFKFSIYHLMDVEDPVSLFPIRNFVVGRRKDGKHSQTPKPRPTIAAKPRPRAAQNQSRSPSSSTSPSTIASLASVVRSKNSGPYEITLDILFDDVQLYRHVRDSNVLCRDLMAQLYRLKDEDITTCMWFEPALGWKCTFRRPAGQPQGSVGERDTFGTQMHAPLLGIEIPDVSAGRPKL